MYELEIRHGGLHKFKIVRGKDKYEVEQKAEVQQEAWDEIWQRKRDKEEESQQKEKKKEQSLLATEQAQENIESLKTILINALDKNYILLYDEVIQNKELPEEPIYPTRPKLEHIPLNKPDKKHEFYKLYWSFANLIPGGKEKREAKMEEKFNKDYKLWEKRKNEIEENNKKLELEYNTKIKKRKNEWKKITKEYEEGLKKLQEEKNRYLNEDESVVAEYCEAVLKNSEYPEFLYIYERELSFLDDTKILIVDFNLPSIESLPKLKEVKYNASDNSFREINLSDNEINKLYDDLLYQITLKTKYELYKTDKANMLKGIVLNGYVNGIDQSTGHEIDKCILSIKTSKEEFLAINLERVSPKECFKKLKGIGSTKLHGLIPVAPIININKEDKRFIDSYEVIKDIDQTSNLAAMDWQDFENLISEIFEKEFANNGGEIKITQASKDGGVDAIAFDPDPIRGGKIVIQAKRYTNIVGVSAVRDLYGTTVNEGATKGILVTTSDYGNDAYNFAKGKPITLLNGNNLLHLLEKHGHRANIDLLEAKKLIKEQAS